MAGLSVQVAKSILEEIVDVPQEGAILKVFHDVLVPSRRTSLRIIIDLLQQRFSVRVGKHIVDVPVSHVMAGLLENCMDFLQERISGASRS